MNKSEKQFVIINNIFWTSAYAKFQSGWRVAGGGKQSALWSVPEDGDYKWPVL